MPETVSSTSSFSSRLFSCFSFYASPRFSCSTSGTRIRPQLRIWLNTMRERYEGKKLIVARDKLDLP
ncbi:hypothetical protein SMACR_09533 [Sordaria macrospora]|uniref:Uncharacterized protein n=1 Tax=Sordaria macrospora TaxID=5147 RepID=A0A8S8ZXW8_SORMA|nr:hypothetical protein SMACR_09533 [Sordaria macrospora]WPJ66822.1 hypothetical protein SMAC4_09533 [Sordaria macrospora]